jgi:predicted acyl esterase
MYQHMEKKDKANYNHIVLGPWNHGQWSRGKADSLGKISFESSTAYWFQALQKKWFDYWLKGKGDGKFEEAYCFQTGTNQWKTYNSWPPKEATIKKLYAGPGNKASFSKPSTATGFVSYISDPC